ncbi:MAG: hypothetical protein FWG14_08995 [Peptococcaceae bacterium]|nr:hypothetical protein [Peptococcaceae bacterium]
MNRLTQQNIDMPVKIAGIGHYFPGEPVTNQQIEEQYGFDSEWVLKHTGVGSRHWADSRKERFVEIAQQAVAMALAKADMRKEEIDILICTSSTVRPVVNSSALGSYSMDIALPLQADAAKQAINAGMASADSTGMIVERMCQAVLIERPETKKRIDSFFDKN